MTTSMATMVEEKKHKMKPHRPKTRPNNEGEQDSVCNENQPSDCMHVCLYLLRDFCRQKGSGQAGK